MHLFQGIKTRCTNH